MVLLSFGRLDVQCRRDSRLFRLYRLFGISHCTCGTFRTRRNLCSTLGFQPPIDALCGVPITYKDM